MTIQEEKKLERIKKRKQDWNNTIHNRDKRRKIQKLRIMLGEDKNEEEMCKELGVSVRILHRLIDRVREYDKLAFMSIDKFAIYSDYLLHQQEVIRQLRRLQTTYSAKQKGYVVGALRLQSEIYDKCIKMGQDFGIIDKKASSLEISGEINIQSINKKQLVAEIEKEVNKMNQLALGGTIEMRPEVTKFAGDTVKYLPAAITGPQKAEEKVEKKAVKKKIKLKIRY